jgi:hypothetical protein
MDIMIYLSPLSRRHQALPDRHPNLGLIVTPISDRSVAPEITWCADNGCYAAGDRFNLNSYLIWLQRPPGDRSRCLFATAPDVVGDANATLRRSAPVLPLLRELGYRAAYVAQDGFDPDVLDWDAFDVLFIGGTTAWKRAERGGYAAIAEGKRRGKWVHVGRVNGGPFLKNVAMAGADSADGTTLVFGPDIYWRRVQKWLTSLDEQVSMQLWEIPA